MSGLGDPYGVHQPDGVIGELPCGVGIIRRRTPARSPVVERQHPVILRENFDLRVPGVAIPRETVDEDYGLPCPVKLVVKLNVTYDLGGH